MSNEELTKDWKKRLQDMSCIPGEEESWENASWQKLEARLNTKRNTRNPLFFWLAAASVFTCILIAFLSGKTEREITAQNLTGQNKQSHKKEIIQPLTQAYTNNIVIEEKTIKATRIINPVKTPLVKSTSIATITGPEKLKAVKEDSVTGITLISEITQSKPIVFASLKKKIPVVHINELEKPVAPVESIAGINDRPAFRLRLFNRNISAGSAADNSDNSTGLKIKLLLQN